VVPGAPRTPPSTSSGSQRFASGELPPGAAFPLQSGQRLAVERVIGRGGMGVVHLVRDDRLGRRAALKLTRATNPRRSLRFRREAQVTAALDHPSIPPVYEAGRTPDGRDYLLMRYVDGEPLTDVLSELDADRPEGAWVGEAAARRLVGALIKVGEAVAYAHEQGVVHRDLKPDNVMVGAFGEVLVMDWGLARVLREDAEADRRLRGDLGVDVGAGALTQDGAVVGTPGFMAPEQARGEDVDGRADVFGLGAILCHGLTGSPPLTGDTVVEVLQRTLEGDVELGPAAGLPPDLRAVLARALAAEREDRYAGAAELVADLRAWLEGRRVSVYRYRASEQALRLLRAHPALFTGIAVGSLAVAAAVGLVVQARAGAREDARREALAAARADAEARWGEASGPAADEDFDARVGAHLEALQAAQRWRVLAPDDRAAARAQFQAAVALGELAQEGEQWALARQAFAEAGGLGVDDERARVLVRLVDQAQRSDAERRRLEVEALLAATARGDLRARRDGVTDAVFRLARYPEPQTTRLLAAALDDLSEELRALERAAYAAVAEPTAAEARRGAEPLEGVAAAWTRRGEVGPAGLAAGERAALAAAEARLVARALPGVEARFDGPEGRTSIVTRYHAVDLNGVLANRQTAGLELGQLDLAAVACRALGRLGLPDDAVPGLARYLQAERSAPRAALALQALGRLGGADARAAALAALDRWQGTDLARHVGPDLGRLLAEGDLRTAPAGVRRLAAEAITAAGRDEAALRVLDRLLADAPRDLEARRLKARVLADRGDADAALRAVDEALALADAGAGAGADEAWLRTERAALLLEAGRTSAAREEATRAIELAPDLARARDVRARTHMAKGDMAAARRDLDAAIEQDPTDAGALGRRAEVRIALYDRAGALADAERATSLEPRAASHWFALGRARALREDFEGARAAYARALRLDPSHAGAWAERGTVRAALGDVAGGRLDCRRALELDPDDASVRYASGVVEHLAGDPEAAEAAFATAVEREPGLAQAWYHRGLLRTEAGEYAEAVPLLDRAIELAPPLALAWNNRGLARVQLGDAGGIDDLDTALELDPRLAQAWNNRGFARLVLQDEPEAARRDLERAVAIDPGLAIAWSNLGQAYVKLDDRPAAIDAFERAIARDPQFGFAYLLRAFLRRETDPAAARADVEQAVRLAPGLPRAWSLRAELRLALDEDAAGAVADLERAAASGSERIRNHYFLGVARSRTGDREGAAAALETYLKKAPRGKHADEARKLLEEQGAGE